MAVISLNSEINQSDVLFNSDRIKISHIVKANFSLPEIAFGLVQNYCTNINNIKRTFLDTESNPNKIVVLVDKTEYQFNLSKNEKTNPPDLK